MYCCQSFENYVLRAGTNGISIVLCSGPKNLQFAMQYRVVSDGMDLEKEMPVISSLQGGITLIATVRVLFCPFCGTELSKIIESYQEQFNELALLHRGISQ